jgi:MFS transporter, FHS family, L-fucose permease
MSLSPVHSISSASSTKRNYNTPLVTLILLFFMWGFITCMNDILIPHLKSLFNLSYYKSMLVQFCFFGAYFIGSVVYFVISYFNGDPINKIGYKNGLILGLIISAVGCLLFLPASSYVVYELFLLALFVLGLGFTLLQIAANPYVAMLGNPESASSRLNLAQAFNSIGTTLAPVIGGYLIFELLSSSQASQQTATEIPYIIFAALFVALAVLVYFIKLPLFTAENIEAKGVGALTFPQLKLGIFAIFFYVGAEVCIGSFMINFLSVEGGESGAKNFLALYWGGAMIGRFIGSIYLNKALYTTKKAVYMLGTAAVLFLLLISIIDLSPLQKATFAGCIFLSFIGYFLGASSSARTLIVFAAVNFVLVLLTIFADKEIATWTIVATGLFNSIMWSNIFTLAIFNLGKYVSQGSSLLIMGILGGALLPLVQGFVADASGLKLSFIIPAVAYLFIIYYGWFCSRRIKAQV